MQQYRWKPFLTDDDTRTHWSLVDNMDQHVLVVDADFVSSIPTPFLEIRLFRDIVVLLNMAEVFATSDPDINYCDKG